MKHGVVLACCVLMLAALPTWSAVPELEPAEQIMVGGSPLSIGAHATVEVVDWNNDGRMDLIVGQGNSPNGRVRWFRNDGSNIAPTLTDQGLIQSGGSDIDVGFS